MHEQEDSSSSAVRVAVRARPLLDKEGVESVSYSPDGDGREVILGKDRRFTFDHVFGPTSTQDQVYLACVKSLVHSCIAGYNATVLAYGQTGSGKTYTMGSANNEGLADEELGILPRAIRQLYESIEENSSQAEFLVKCSFMEIYNEEIKDLLHPNTPSKSIFIREDANGDIILAGVREEVVTSYEDMIKFLEQGSVFRTTGSTLMNQHSSRSHAIFTIIVEQRSLLQGADSNDVITAKFHLVDLAGSERAKRTGAVGMRFKESVTINSGLLALGNVISALGDERKRGQHVPYRQSKLTRILQDSLGGNSRTCMIACISTAEINYEETLNTLKYANRARNIRNKPIINRDPRAVQLNQLRLEVKALQEELSNFRTWNSANGKSVSNGISKWDSKNQPYLEDLRLITEISADDVSEIQNVRCRILRAEEECLKLKQDLQASQLAVSNLQEEMMDLHKERQSYQSRFEEICSEMNSLLQTIPQWESGREISESPITYLVEMAKRILGNIDGNIGRFSEPCSLNQNGFENSKEKKTEMEIKADPRFLQENAFNVENNCSLTPRNLVPFKAQGTYDIIKEHLKTIRKLEEQLAEKEVDVQGKNKALAEANKDLVRDEQIFVEKMMEINALRKCTRDLSTEKEMLLRKAKKDTATILHLSNEVIVRENELNRLKESVISAHPDSVPILSPSISSKEGMEKNTQNNNKRWISSGDNIHDKGKVSNEINIEERIGELEKVDQEESQSTSQCIYWNKWEFERNKEDLERKMYQLTSCIDEKEEMIKELLIHEADSKHLTHQYETAMIELQSQIRHKEEEVESLKRELEELDKNASKSDEEKRKIRDEYEGLLMKIVSHLAALKKQRAKQETQRFEQLKIKSEIKAQQLQLEISKMKIQQEGLRRQIRDITEKFENQQETHLKDIAILKIQSDQQLRLLQEIEDNMERSCIDKLEESSITRQQPPDSSQFKENMSPQENQKIGNASCNISEEITDRNVEEIEPRESKPSLRKWLRNFMKSAEAQPTQDLQKLPVPESKLNEEENLIKEEFSSRLEGGEFQNRLTELQKQYKKRVKILLKQFGEISTTSIERPRLETEAADACGDVEDSEVNLLLEKSEFNSQNNGEFSYRDMSMQKQSNARLQSKMKQLLAAWYTDKQEEMEENMEEEECKAWETRAISILKQHEKLERDHQALKEELENTKSLMHKAGLGIRLPERNVRELLHTGGANPGSDLAAPLPSLPPSLLSSPDK